MGFNVLFSGMIRAMGCPQWVIITSNPATTLFSLVKCHSYDFRFSNAYRFLHNRTP
jgi:hypothetical protein